MVADYVGYRWNKGGRKLLASSYAKGQPGAFPTGQLVPGLTKAFDGARPGSRVVARIPPKDGFGDEGIRSTRWVRTTRSCMCWTSGRCIRGRRVRGV